MDISFLGPIGCVTGSCYWLRHHTEGGSALEFLVDCGARQGERDNDAWNKAPLPFQANRIDFVLLTHAHLDHCGLLPRLVREGFRGEVYCTDATRDLASIILLDGAKHEGAAYGVEDVERLRFRSIDTAMRGPGLNVRGDVIVQAYRTAHIYGAVSIRVLWGSRKKQRSMTFSGDLGPNETCGAPMPLHAARCVPLPSDYVLVESTYGNRARPADESSDAQRLERLQTAVQRALVDEDGVLLIPCFAVDRLQAVLFDLHRLWWRDRQALAGAEVFVHSTMATKVNQVYARHLLKNANGKGAGTAETSWCGEATLRELRHLSKPALKRNDAIRELASVLDHGQGASPRLPRLHQIATECDEVVSRTGRKIILTTAGMCSGGPVQTYLSSYLHAGNTTLLLTGYQSEGTLGRHLLDLCDQRLRGELVEGRIVLGKSGSMDCSSVQATIERLSGYSAHADQAGLVTWLLGSDQAHGAAAGTIFLTHGDDRAREGLRNVLMKRISADGGSQVVETPYDTGKVFDLDAGGWRSDKREGMRVPLGELCGAIARLKARLVA
ncbi:MAG: MBL fold metallo-hydrolase [Myxococcales bacterium]|nr:MBL fold metallo-hydrolase [Myxococcales bacterium]